jgi:hypothetical protein
MVGRSNRTILSRRTADRSQASRGRGTWFIGLTARGACLACEAVVSRGDRDAETPLRQGSIAQVCLFPHPRAQLNAAQSPTVSLAHHGLAPRLAPYVDAIPQPRDAWLPSLRP